MPGMSRETANAILPSSITLTVVCVVATVVFVLMVFTRLGDRFPPYQEHVDDGGR